MFNINDVKVGDYVENRDGDVGYVVGLKVKYMNFTTREYDVLPFEWCIANTKKYKVMTPKMESNPENYFKQIGTYVFDDKDKIKPLTPKAIYKDVKCKKIETKAEDYPSSIAIDSIPYTYERILDHIEYDNVSMGDKINEIIKWINERG